MNRRWLFPATVLVLLVTVGWWVMDERRPQPERPDSQVEQQRQPDYFTENFTLLATDAQGKPAWELRSPRMVHYSDQDLWQLDRPDMLYHTATGKPWRLTAERGRAWSGLDEAMLEGEVHVTREAGPDNAASRLDTSDVRLWPDQRLAETDMPAVYRSEGHHATGVGARGDFTRDTLKLRSEVNAHYAPPAD